VRRGGGGGVGDEEWGGGGGGGGAAALSSASPPVMDGSALPWEGPWPSDRARTAHDWEGFLFFLARRLWFGALGGGLGNVEWLLLRSFYVLSCRKRNIAPLLIVRVIFKYETCFMVFNQDVIFFVIRGTFPYHAD